MPKNPAFGFSGCAGQWACGHRAAMRDHKRIIPFTTARKLSSSKVPAAGPKPEYLEWHREWVYGK